MYNVRKTIKYLAEQGVVEAYKDNGTVRYSSKRRFSGKSVRFVKIDLNRITLELDERQRSQNYGSVPTQSSFADWVEVGPDEEFPF